MGSVTATQGDLTTMEVDVVVNAANQRLQHGGGVAAALAAAGGPAVQQESEAWVSEHGPVGVGEAAVTTAGNMPADRLVHVVGPRYASRPEDPDHLASAVLAALEATAEMGAGSVALPAISCGVFGYPVAEATRIIAATAATWIATTPDVELDIHLIGYDAELAGALQAGLDDFDPLADWPDSAPGIAERPAMPDGYGLPDDGSGMQDWRRAEQRLAQAETVWLATTRPDGRPHVVPRWGVWLDNQFFYDGAPTTRHVRNLVASEDGATTLHLESGTDVVIVNGHASPTSPPGRWRAVQLAAAFHAKYAEAGYSPTVRSWDGEGAGGLCRFVPTDALAWANFPTDCTRWQFDAREDRA